MQIDRIAHDGRAGGNGDGRPPAEREHAVRAGDDRRSAARHRDVRGADDKRCRAERVRDAHAHLAAPDTGVDDLAHGLVVESGDVGSEQARMTDRPRLHARARRMVVACCDAVRDRNDYSEQRRGAEHQRSIARSPLPRVHR
jgi:hypothetical protein